MSKGPNEFENGPSSISCGEVITFGDAEIVGCWNKRNYKVAVSIGVKPSHMRPMTYVFDTGAGPSRKRGDLLGASWKGHIRRWECPDLYSVENAWLKTAGTAMLLLRFGEARTRILFLVIKQLSVSMLRATSFIGRCIKLIILEERKVVSHHSSTGPILMVKENDGYNNKTSP